MSEGCCGGCLNKIEKPAGKFLFVFLFYQDYELKVNNGF
jgi:hypothetical protein